MDLSQDRGSLRHCEGLSSDLIAEAMARVQTSPSCSSNSISLSRCRDPARDRGNGIFHLTRQLACLVLRSRLVLLSQLDLVSIAAFSADDAASSAQV